MERLRIRRTRRKDIPEIERIAGQALVSPAELRKFRFAALEPVIEVDEECPGPLSLARDFLFECGIVGREEIVVPAEFLALRVMEDICLLEASPCEPGRVGDSCVQNDEYKVGREDIEHRQAVGARLMTPP